MNRFLPELDRLYGLGPKATGEAAAGVGDTGGLRQGIRVAVLAVALPAGWTQLSTVWRGVQADLALPAPAIAVSGFDALQLWFSFASPTSPATATRFLRGLRKRYLGETRPAQVREFADAAELPVTPCVEVRSQCWSAFVTHDLASVFEDTPWLDLAPTSDGQATILRALEPMPRAALEAALDQLEPTEDAPVPALSASLAAAAASPGPPEADPVRFLARVMNDETVPLALRIDAAKVLLPFAKRS